MTETIHFAQICGQCYGTDRLGELFEYRLSRWFDYDGNIYIGSSSRECMICNSSRTGDYYGVRYVVES